MGAMGIIQVNYYGVFVCICRLYLDVFKIYTPHAFVYRIHFSQKDKSECFGAIIDNRYHAPIFYWKKNIEKANMH